MIGVLVSGRGTNLQALLDAGLPVNAVASNRTDAPALLRARAAAVPTATFSLDCHAYREERDLVMATWLEEHGVELVVLAGYMHLLTKPFLDRFLALIPITVAVLSLLALLCWQAAIRRSPTVFSDELEWAQISRAIAATGHAARRGEPIHFKSLYAFLIAPCWWIASTSAAYTAIKYLNTVVMALAAVPAWLAPSLRAPGSADHVADHVQR